jgi:1-acyl-sn-glycerol-3-phosphate acyltransferase
MFYDLSKLILWLFFRIGFGLEVRGQEHVPTRGGFVVASNHVSYLDPPVVGVACPRRVAFMARTTLFAHPLLGMFLRGVHAIPLRRGEADHGAIGEAIARLRRGLGVAIFPEGTRQLSGVLGAARRGVGLLAVSAQVPIVPALVTGTFEAMPPEAKRLARAKIRVAFGPAIPYTSSVSSSSRHQELADAVTQTWHRLAEQVAR